MITRRALLAAGVCLPPTWAWSQPVKGKVARIGVLGAGAAEGWSAMVAALRDGLGELGYVENKNYVFEFRWGEGRYERLPGLAKELVAGKVDIIVTHATAGVRAAQSATQSIPIVMASIGDPVASKLVGTLRRPGGNTTGFSFFSHEISAKRLELLKEAMPRIASVAVLLDTGAGTVLQDDAHPMHTAARSLKLGLKKVLVSATEPLETQMARLAKEGAGGVMVIETPYLISNGRTIGELATKYKLPSIGFKEVAEGGGLMSYGADIAAMWRRAAVYIDKILKGSNAGDLPVDRAMKFEMVVNLKVAKALGITIPQTVMLRATKVLE